MVPLSGQQSLREVLRASGIPPARFSSAELSERVNAASAKDGNSTYLTYFAQSRAEAPVLVRHDAKTGAVLRNNLKAGEVDDCCGTTPLQIDFTHNFLLASFHVSPSASLVLVADKQLRYKTTLFAIDFKEFAPDRVVYVESQVHFAPQHPSRLAYADLRTGEKVELYPSKNDPLREAFADIHEKHMPAEADCGRANDPCDPDVYDEDIEFVDAHADGFRIRVTRRAEHGWVTKDAVVDVPFQMATYTYQRTGAGWMYCAVEDAATVLIKSTDEAIPAGKAKACVPNLPVVPVAAGPFSPHAQEKR
jgi:hypothetical protein